jgi:geranylgeranyl diphosphate synthase, type II
MEEQFTEIRELFERYLNSYMAELVLPKSEAIAKLFGSMNYSLQAGGKRFRPTLALAFCEEFSVNPMRALPWVTAVEMIHTYSLIHDDLPCMDNDDERRGKPTNHKVFGEAQALLAGDALLTEAFAVIATKYHHEPNLVVTLVRLLSEAAGIRGMVGGQAIDMLTQNLRQTTQQELELIHKLKTGALIRVSIEGAAAICGLPQAKVDLSRKFGELIGLSFQIADDLLDFDLDDPEPGNFATVIGPKETKALLQNVSSQALKCLGELGLSSKNLNLLSSLVEYNRSRTI